MMNKKELKFYEAPACEVMELEVESVLLAGSGETNAEGINTETPLDGGEE